MAGVSAWPIASRGVGTPIRGGVPCVAKKEPNSGGRCGQGFVAMPYIPQVARDRVLQGGITTPGELNYFIFWHLLKYVDLKGKAYQTYNDIIGALEGVKTEFYRTQIVPFEEGKKRVNGDVR